MSLHDTASDCASVLTDKARRESHQRKWSKEGKRVHRQEVFLFENLEEEQESIKFHPFDDDRTIQIAC